MPRLNEGMEEALAAIPGVNLDELRKAQRAAQVRQMWTSLVEPFILEHTNGVYIFTDEKKRQRVMHVYVDDSLVASELNNRRELLKLNYLEEFNEVIEDFQIHISRGRYKHMHPFEREEGPLHKPIPLDEEEMKEIDDICRDIPDEKLRESFKRAMICDLEWKKGSKGSDTP